MFHLNLIKLDRLKFNQFTPNNDIEEGMVKPKRGHEFFQLTKDVELDYISG